MKILCTGDVHIGRRPSRLPESDGRAHSCGEAWGRIVDAALAEAVDLVLVSGDLIDERNRFYEAAGPLEMGVRRLTRAGVRMMAVAGNHDHDALPWMLEGLGPDVTLLGRGGRWQRERVMGRDGVAVDVDGWSFPARSVPTSPLTGYRHTADGVPLIGLLHADLDQPTSRYAPVALAELRASAPALWVLGHVHAPRHLESAGSATILYPGSPQAMDPGEGGTHGIWIVDVERHGVAGYRLIPLSTVRYQDVTVDVDGLADEPAVHRRVVDGVRVALRDAVETADCLRWLCCRVRVVGRTPLHRTLQPRLERLCAELALESGDARAIIEAVRVETRPARELRILASGSADAPSVLARLVLSLDAGHDGGDHDDILRDAARRTAEVRNARPYLKILEDDEPDPTEVEARVRERATVLLDELLAQKEADA